VFLPFSTKVWFYRTPIDFRKQIDGLVLLVSSRMQHDPCSGQLFVFRNKGCDRIKLLYYDENGFWLLYKRMERGKFIFPSIEDEALELSRDQLSWLLSGLDFSKHEELPKTKAKYFYLYIVLL
jgi:transposase